MPTLSQDPTQQAGNRRKARAALKSRLAGANREINQYFESLPRRAKQVNSLKANKTIFEWLVDSFSYNQALREIRQIIERWLQTQGSERQNFFNKYIERAYQQGAINASLRVQLLAGQAGFSDAELARLEPLQIINSVAYRDRLNIVFTRQFAEMKGLSDDTIVSIARVLTDTITNGQSPRKAQREIKRQFGLARKRAERIARTEINRSNSLGRLDQNKDTRNRLGIDVRVIHRSALQGERTRREHGLRHGKVFTIEDQQQWWDIGSNRINCLCSTSEIVFDENGKPYSSGLLKRFEVQRKAHYGQ